MLTVHFVRHGDTTQAAEGIFCGDLDPPLTETGRAQAERVAAIATDLGVTALYCSPKLRARMTAEPIARSCRLEPRIAEGLREIAYGAWEGRKELEVRQNEREAFEAWQANPELVSPPGGETAFAIAARALPVVVRVRAEHEDGQIMVVSHKATVRVIVCALLGMPLGYFRTHVACPTASITTFEFNGSSPMVVAVGDVHHLQGRHGP